jgi:ribosome-associated protein
MPTKTIEIRTTEIRLDSLLKFAGLVATGGEAKMLIQSGCVQVNGEWETRRSRTVRHGDQVVLHDEEGQPVHGLTVCGA